MTPRRIDDTPTGGVTEESSYFLVSNNHNQSRGNSNGATGYRSQSPQFGLGSSFWVTLSEEINGLKDVLIGSSNEDEAEDGRTPALSLSSF